jgi:acyl-CoA thioesterase
MAGVKFSDVLGGLRPSDHGWTANIPDDWAQGRTTFGGLQVALAARAMRGVLGSQATLPLRSLQATFVAAMPTGGEIELRAELLRSGRTASHVRCDLWHAGSLACSAVGLFGGPRTSQVALDIPRPDAPSSPDSLPDLPYVPGITPAFIQHLQLRWTVGAWPHKRYDEPRSLIYARLRDADCRAEDTLIALADSIPTPALSMLAKPAPASSLTWMLEILGDPAQLDRSRWSLIGTEVRAGTDGYLSQTSVLWGPNGHAFSVSHQSVAIFG